MATGRDEAAIAREIGADAVIYQDLSALEEAVSSVNPKLSSYETSCFNGEYITGDITPAYLDAIEAERLDGKAGAEQGGSEQMIDLNLNVAEQNLM